MIDVLVFVAAPPEALFTAGSAKRNRGLINLFRGVKRFNGQNRDFNDPATGRIHFFDRFPGTNDDWSEKTLHVDGNLFCSGRGIQDTDRSKRSGRHRFIGIENSSIAQ